MKIDWMGWPLCSAVVVAIALAMVGFIYVAGNALIGVPCQVLPPDRTIYVEQFTHCMQLVTQDGAEATPDHIKQCDSAARNQARSR